MVKPLMLPPSVYGVVEQVTTTLFTAPAGIVPEPLLTVHVAPVGCADTLTA
jgi:hypothetical protein